MFVTDGLSVKVCLLQILCQDTFVTVCLLRYVCYSFSVEVCLLQFLCSDIVTDSL